MPDRHSLFWRLLLLIGSFCLAMVWVTQYFAAQIRQSSYLSEEVRQVLRGYAREAEAALQQGIPALKAWLREMETREPGWMIVVDRHLQPVRTRTMADEVMHHRPRA